MTVDLPRLARTALYRAAWGGRVPSTINDAPPLSVWQWRRHVHERADRSLTAEPALWVLYPVPGDDPIWIPFGPPDLEAGAGAAQQTFAGAGVTAGDVVLAVAPPAPWAGNTLPYLFSAADRLAPQAVRERSRVEVFPLSVSTVEYKADLAAFPLSREPAVIAGSPGDVSTLLALAASTVSRPRFRLALLTEPALPEDMSNLAESVAALLYVPGLFAPVGGRPDVPGVWLPPDLLYAELIRDDEWGRATQDFSRAPKILPMAEAIGESGELVVTVHNSVLPVIRLRTAIRVRVAEADEAGNVRIEFLHILAPRVPEAAAAFAPAGRR